MQLKKYEIKTYVTKEIYLRINQEATARNSTMAKVMRDSLAEYFLLREELANAIESPGSMGDSHSGKIIHTLLARTEERLLLTIECLQKQLIETLEQQQLLSTMIDLFYLELMKYLPQIPKELLANANAMAKERHNKWREKLKEGVFGCCRR